MTLPKSARQETDAPAIVACLPLLALLVCRPGLALVRLELDGGPVGPLATLNREPGQAWKGAAAAVDVCAGVWLAGPAALSRPPTLLQIFIGLMRVRA